MAKFALGRSGYKSLHSVARAGLTDTNPSNLQLNKTPEHPTSRAGGYSEVEGSTDQARRPDPVPPPRST